LIRLLLLSCVVGSCAIALVGCSHAPRGEEEDLGASPAEIAAGQKMAEEQCGTCHAVARDTQSPMRNAPPFSYLGRNYPISSLAEALAEGIITGHDGMPEWELEPAEIRGLLGYIQSVQEP
jgi:cytochrome c